MADEQKPAAKALTWRPLAFFGTEKVHSIYADATFVSRTADDITISFFLTTRPPLSNEELATLEAIPTECVARLILPVRVVKHMAGLLNEMVASAEQEPERD
jgi:hypothetical protein